MSQSRSTQILEQALAPLVLLSTATKPLNIAGVTRIPTGQRVIEYDTGRVFKFNGTDWIFESNPDYLFSTTTIDLSQAAGNYDLFDAPATVAMQVLEFGLIIPADLTGAAAGALTGISVQSTDDTPVVLIAADPDGKKANLTANKHLIYTGADVVAAGKKIQLTIVDGATTAAQVCSCWIKYQGVV